MKKVVLLGDSIREWYTNYVVELLKDKCEVISLLGDNGRFTYYSLFQLSMILKEHVKVDLVHFNNGYWDMVVMPFLNRPVFSLEEYKHGLKRIIELSRAAGADLIFATTTPLPSDVAAEDNTGTGVTFGFEQDREVGRDILTVDSLSKTVDGEKLLDNISFTMSRDDKIAVIGENEHAVTALMEILADEGAGTMVSADE